MLTYAVGDLHGCLDLLRSVPTAIRRHSKGRLFQIVFLGDYVDRGLDTKGVLELLPRFQNQGRAVFLLGNHEQMLLRCMRHGSKATRRVWLENGGGATLASYGLDPNDAAGVAQLPPSHIDWLTRRPSIYATGDLVFVHAGIDPYKALHEQGPREFLWIRDRFLSADPLDFIERRHIVHGHTPVWEGKPDCAIPEFLPHRTNLDTGAYETGLLTIGVFDADTRGPIDLLSIS